MEKVKYFQMCARHRLV